MSCGQTPACELPSLQVCMNKRNVRAVRDGYSRMAAEYARLSFGDTADSLDHRLLDLLLPLVDGVVCDLGCGPGHNTRYIKDQGLQVVGVDVSPGMIDQARARNQDIEFSVGDMHRLDVPDGAWGAIAALYSIIHIPRGEVVQVLRELARALSPGGLLLLSFYIGQVTCHSKQWRQLPVSMTYTHFQSIDMQALLTKAGFEVVASSDFPQDSARARECIFARKRTDGS